MDQHTRDLERAYEQFHGSKPLVILPTGRPEHDAVLMAMMIQSVLARFKMELLDADQNVIAVLKVVGYVDKKLIGILERFEGDSATVCWSRTNGNVLRPVDPTTLVPGSTIRIEQHLSMSFEQGL